MLATLDDEIGVSGESVGQHHFMRERVRASSILTTSFSPGLPSLSTVATTTNRPVVRPKENRVRLSLSQEQLDEILSHLAESPWWHKPRAVRMRMP